jgi:hypothetical protein
MAEGNNETGELLVFTENNPDNISQVLRHFKNILIRGVVGVGKITNTVEALKENTNVYYVGNPVDYEGKNRPGSYEQYLNYILSFKQDLHVVEDLSIFFASDEKIVLIIDEIYGRSEEQLDQISKLMDMENIQIVQIVGCMKNMGGLIDKVDIAVDLHHDGAIIVDKAMARSICRIFGREEWIQD